MTDPKATLQKLNKNLSILQEREAKFADNAPLDLLNQITDHQQAIDLTRQVITGEISEADWREAMRPLLINVHDRSEAQPDTCGISMGDVEDSIIASGDVANTQVAHGSYIAQASHGGKAEVNINTIDQRGQQVETQYNAGGDINIYNNQTPPSLYQRGGYIIIGAMLAMAVNVAGNLLSAGLEQRFFSSGFTTQSLWGLGLFALAGGILGLWLSGPVTMPAPTASPAQPVQPVTITRLRALLTYIKLRGKGINLSDILLIGSKLDIDTWSNDDPPHH
ncbi:MAG: hypothetical protein JW953_09015 [Anaerolineae bacterium]|nr:hypothetical protein [Anaerolineae bacterium]